MKWKKHFWNSFTQPKKIFLLKLKEALYDCKKIFLIGITPHNFILKSNKLFSNKVYIIIKTIYTKWPDYLIYNINNNYAFINVRTGHFCPHLTGKNAFHGEFHVQRIIPLRATWSTSFSYCDHNLFDADDIYQASTSTFVQYQWKLTSDK